MGARAKFRQIPPSPLPSGESVEEAWVGFEEEEDLGGERNFVKLAGSLQREGRSPPAADAPAGPAAPG